jgi:hypothetical protein
MFLLIIVITFKAFPRIPPLSPPNSQVCKKQRKDGRIEQHLGGVVIYKIFMGLFNDESGNTLVYLLGRKDS